VGTSIAYQRLLLRRLYRSALEAGLTLSEQLNQFADARIDATSSGGEIVATSANGHSVTFAPPGGNFSQVELAETAGRLLDLYDRVAAAVTTGDAAVYSAMLSLLRKASHHTYRFTNIRN